MDYQETIFTAKKEKSSIIYPYFICGSFNVAVSSSNYADQMTGTVEGLKKEAVKVKFCPYMPRRLRKGAETLLHSYLSSVLDGNMCSTSHRSCFTPKVEPHHP